MCQAFRMNPGKRFEMIIFGSYPTIFLKRAAFFEAVETMEK
jgi:hypothetical protein